MRFISSILQVLKRPRFIISLLIYFITVLGLKILLGINLLNIFTILLIPITASIIYSIWNIFYNENINDELFDDEIQVKYAKRVSKKDLENLKKLSLGREEIQKFSEKSDLNPSKESLISQINSLDLNKMIEKFASNGERIKFIDDFLNNKASAWHNIPDKDTITKLKNAKDKYEKLNQDIINLFEMLQAKAVLLLTEDVNNEVSAKEAIDDIINKVKIIDTSNEKINDLYLSIQKGKDYV